MSFDAGRLPERVLNEINAHLKNSGFSPLTGRECTNFLTPSPADAHFRCRCCWPRHEGDTVEYCSHAVSQQVQVPPYGWVTVWTTTHADGRVEDTIYLELDPDLREKVWSQREVTA